MIYGYVRCSTNETKQDVNRQVRDIKGLVNEKIDFIYSEYESGTKTDRAELNKLLNAVNIGDTIVCTEVSRISRSTKQLCEIIELAQNKKLKLIFGGFVVDCTKELDPMTEGMLKLIGVFAEMERNMIEKILMLIPTYKELKEEWEKQNKMLDEQKMRISKLERDLKEEKKCDKD